MRLPFALYPALLVMGFLFSESAANAEYMNWSYHWSISPSPVLASGTGSVSQALGQGGMVGSTHFLAAAVTTSSDASARNPDRFRRFFNLTLHLKDRATNQSGTLTFRGLISGTLTGTSARLTESFLTPTEHLKLGNHMYWVRLPSHFTLLPPGAGVRDYYASMWVQNLPPPPPSHPQVMAASLMLAGPSIASVGHIGPVPEPSSLVLVSLGVVLLGGAVIRRNRLGLSALGRLARLGCSWA